MVGDDVETDIGGALARRPRRDPRPHRQVPRRRRARVGHRADRHGRLDRRRAGAAGRGPSADDPGPQAAGLSRRPPGRALRPLPRAGARTTRTGSTCSRAPCCHRSASCCSGSGRADATMCRVAGRCCSPRTTNLWDHFFCGVYLRRRISFMAKSQLFDNPVLTAILVHGGAFPVRRGHRDDESMATARSRSSSAAGRCWSTRRAGAPATASSAPRGPGSDALRWRRGRRWFRSRSTARLQSAAGACRA